MKHIETLEELKDSMYKAAESLTKILPNVGMVLMVVTDGQTYMISNFTAPGDVELILAEFLMNKANGEAQKDPNIIVKKEHDLNS